DVPKSEVAEREEAILAFWQEHDIFNRSLKQPAGDAPKGDYVFYDGPPFATGLPHYGHILAGTMKDAIPRFWTMQGYHVRRQWGWDCHGLPVENLIEKKLGLATKRDIEAYGIKNFNEAARESVMEYADDWRQIIPRMGRFVDMENDYKTMDSTYTESVWWVFKQLYEKGLVFEGFKSMHLCPRCGTTLSNFEVNQGYKDIKDISVFVEFPLVDEPGTSLLAWTTTPWTLPGNMALAVNEEIEYAVIDVKTETGAKRLVLAKDRVAAVLKESEYTVVEMWTGKDLLGKKIEPPFPWLATQLTEEAPNAWTVLHADFVEVGEEGTGIVHIAPAYGEDDMKLGQKHGLPIIHHVDEGGHFKDFVTDFAGQLVKPKDDEESEVNHMDADIEIIRALAAKGRLFAKEKITHSYPHCWRCDTPLLNYATTSWFVDVPSIKDKLVAANETVGWVPEHVGTNRFGKWLEGARDWAVSRQRYWGAPLPIWKNPETNEVKVFGSRKDMQKYAPTSGNTYFTMRHGLAESNVKHVISCNKENSDGLTEEGKQQVEAVVANLPEQIDIIIHSGFQRTKETAEIVAAAHPEAEVIEDDRVRELDLSDDYEGGKWKDYNAQFATWEDRFTKKLEGSENRRDVQMRMGAFIESLEETYADKKILIVSHAGPLFGLECFVKGLSLKESEAYFADEAAYHANAEVRELVYAPLPHNDYYELDFHRPYIDDFVLEENGVQLERIPDVFDCWFESGSMPYAQFHYPFEQSFGRSHSPLDSAHGVTVPASTAPSETVSAKSDLIPKSLLKEQSVQLEFEQRCFPAQFIAEGLDQTRGWFYSMLVLGVALFGKSPFENVIVNGLVLAEDGKKMSKSLQNYPDPLDLANRVGVDAMRFYLLSSPVIRGEDLNFSEKEVLELQRKNIGRLHNVLAMYEMYADGGESRSDSPHVLDRWIIARLNQLVAESTAGYKAYELDKATRPITDFIDDLSVWYLRRSRDRLKGEDTEDKTRALATLRYTLRTLALVMAPAMPFYAEYLWQAVKEEGDAESVHLGKWPEGGEVDHWLIGCMVTTRDVVSAGLELRTKAKLNVRQPLASVKFKVESNGVIIPDEFIPLIKDELNVKEVISDSVLKNLAELDTTLTPELLAEGAVRELMRAVQGRRKAEGLAPEDPIVLTIDTDETGQVAVAANQDLLVKTVGADSLIFAKTEGEVVKAGEFAFTFSIQKL
ncbi:class I tRNA ligase family protein, partial [Candidatus Kaiserbacteria bacterium]|nr:class I tRNA ligase family protein [Candidatus Kaiserbacteria bacterium]